MLAVRYVVTNGTDKDFISLSKLLDSYLDGLVGGRENRSFYIPLNQLEHIHNVILAYYKDEVVGCASFRHFESGIAEIKRVFVKKEFRGNGISKELMRQIEALAKEKGYTKLVLESGELLVEAMNLYTNLGYRRIPNYGEYKNCIDSICMEKSLKSLSEMTLEELWKLFPIVLKEYNPVYRNWYIEEKHQIERVLNSYDIVRISHIGSTAIKGLLAKPIIDILLEVSDNCDSEKIKEALLANGWLCMSEQHKPLLRISFNKGYTQQGFAEKVYHLHLRKKGDCDELYFRDYIRVHNDIAQQYECLKKKLKEKFEYNRDTYTREKTEFVDKYTKIAKVEFENKWDDFFIVKAKKEEVSDVVHIVKTTIQDIYPRYYPSGAVDFFLEYHNKNNILQDILNGMVWILKVNTKIVGTVTIKEKEINRFFVLPSFQKKGYGRELMDFSEEEIFEKYNCIILAASFPAQKMYEERGYQVIAYDKILCDNGDYLCYNLMQLSYQPYE